MELFYYTSTDTMRYVLTKGDIFATNIRYMNDSEEYMNGLKELYQLSQQTELVKKWIQEKGYHENLLDKIQNLFSESNLKDNMRNMEHYSISFCKKNDLLSQWAIYAKESGVSIRMNFEESSYIFQTESVETDMKAKWNIQPQEVSYFTWDSMKNDMVAYNEAAFKILDQLYEQTAKDQDEWKKERWQYLSTLVKRYDFYQEEEYRLIFEPGESAYQPKIEYRLDKKVLKPYMDIECVDGWPVWEVMVGPGFNQQLVYDSVEHLLNHAETKTGIRSAGDYVKRMQRYLDNAPGQEVLQKCREYTELMEQCSQTSWQAKELDDAQIYIFRQMNEMRKAICEDKQYDEELRRYFKECGFTRSGVVLTKSSIPYIF